MSHLARDFLHSEKRLRFHPGAAAIKSPSGSLMTSILRAYSEKFPFTFFFHYVPEWPRFSQLRMFRLPSPSCHHFALWRMKEQLQVCIELVAVAESKRTCAPTHKAFSHLTECYTELPEALLCVRAGQPLCA